MTGSNQDAGHEVGCDRRLGGDGGGEPGQSDLTTGAPGADGECGSEPGRELIRTLIEEQARLQRCRACGRMLRACTVAVRAATPERLDAAITCGACGATMLVTVRPTGGEGSAHIG